MKNSFGIKVAFCNICPIPHRTPSSDVTEQ